MHPRRLTIKPLQSRARQAENIGPLFEISAKSADVAPTSGRGSAAPDRSSAQDSVQRPARWPNAATNFARHYDSFSETSAEFVFGKLVLHQYTRIEAPVAISARRHRLSAAILKDGLGRGGWLWHRIGNYHSGGARTRALQPNGLQRIFEIHARQNPPRHHPLAPRTFAILCYPPYTWPLEVAQRNSGITLRGTYPDWPQRT